MSGELGSYTFVVGNEGDRNDLDLWYKGGSMIENVAAQCSNTIVVIHSVGPVSFSWSNHPNITGIFYAGAPGEQTGPAIVDVIYGLYNPSGRLPFSIADVRLVHVFFFKLETNSTWTTSRTKARMELQLYTTASDTPMYVFSVRDNVKFSTSGINTDRLFKINYTEKLLLDYRYMDAQSITPRFEFGFGLSYTTFAYSSLSITGSAGTYTISFQVKNSGAVAGTEKPQLYLAYPAAAGEPKKVLRGFEEVPLAVGATQAVSLTLDKRAMRQVPPSNFATLDAYIFLQQYLGYTQSELCPCVWNVHSLRWGVNQGY